MLDSRDAENQYQQRHAPGKPYVAEHALIGWGIDGSSMGFATHVDS